MKDPIKAAKGRGIVSIPASLGPNTECQPPQDPTDRHGANYDNNHPNDWIRGVNEDATTKPGFDHSVKRKPPYGR
jgi:hypothetical protein